MGWHLVITEEMRAMGLKGNDLLVYALVYGFSQRKQGCYYGGIRYIMDVTGLTDRASKDLVKRLTKKGYIHKFPATINGKNINCLMAIIRGEETSPRGRNFTSLGEETSPNNIIDNIIINNNTLSNTRARGKFQIPSIDELKSYCEERNNGLDAEAIFDHYSANGWKVGGAPMKDWKAAVRNWERRQQDFKKTEKAKTKEEEEADWWRQRPGESNFRYNMRTHPELYKNYNGNNSNNNPDEQ